MKISAAAIVKTSKTSKFVRYTQGNFVYKTDSGFEFYIPIEDIGTAQLLAEDRTILFMRWINKHVVFLNGN